MEELKYYDYIRHNNIEMSSVDAVWQADDLLPKELKDILL